MSLIGTCKQINEVICYQTASVETCINNDSFFMCLREKISFKIFMPKPCSIWHINIGNLTICSFMYVSKVPFNPIAASQSHFICNRFNPNSSRSSFIGIWPQCKFNNFIGCIFKEHKKIIISGNILPIYGQNIFTYLCINSGLC